MIDNHKHCDGLDIHISESNWTTVRKLTKVVQVQFHFLFKRIVKTKQEMKNQRNRTGATANQNWSWLMAFHTIVIFIYKDKCRLIQQTVLLTLIL